MPDFGIRRAHTRADTQLPAAHRKPAGGRIRPRSRGQGGRKAGFQGENAQEAPGDVRTGTDTPANEKAASGTETGSNYTEQQADSIRYEGRTFKNIIAGIDTSVSSFFNKWRSGRKSNQGEKLEKLYLGKLSESALEQVSSILGYEVSERDVIVTNDDVKHIVTRHPDLTDWVFDALPQVVSAPDAIIRGHDGVNKNVGKTGVIFEKMYPGGNIVAVQFDNPGRGTMQINTVYKTKKSKSTTSMEDVGNASPTFTSKTTEPVLFNSNIAQKPAEVNTVYAENQKNIPRKLSAPAAETAQTARKMNIDNAGDSV